MITFDQDAWDVMKRMVLRGTAGSLIIRIIAAASAFTMNVVLARVLTVAEYGTVALGLSWLLIVAILACFGTDTVSVRFIAEANAKGDQAQISGIMRWGRNLTLSFGSVFGLVSCILIYFMFSDYSLEQLSVLFIIVMSTPLLALALNRAGVLRGVKKAVSAATVEMLVKPIGILILVSGAAWFSDWSPSLVIVALAIFIGHIVMMLISVGTTQNITLSNETATSVQKKQWLSVAKPIALMSVMGVLISNVDTILVGYFVNADSAGIYRASAQLANLVTFGLAASNGIVAPLIAELYSSGKREALYKTLRYSVAIVSLAGVGGALVMAIAGPYALQLFGTEYQAGYQVLLILLGTQAVNALCGPTGIMMLMTGHQTQATKIFMASAIGSVALNFILIPIYGIVGAAIANMLGVVAWNVAILFYLKHKLDLDPSILAWLRPAFSGQKNL